MKKLSCFGILLLVGGLSVSAQTNPTPQKNSKPMTTNQFPNSDLVMLSDDTKVDVATDGSFQALRHVRSTILTKRGLTAAEVVIPFNDKYQEVEFHFAKVTLPDGSQQSVKPDDVETVAGYPGYPAYGDVEVVQYLVRGAEVGATLDQEYVLKAKPVMGDQFWMVWKPRTSQPVLDTHLVLRMPAGRKFQWRSHNFDAQPQIVESSDKQWQTYTWSYAAPTGVIPEPYMPSPEDCFPWIEISTVDSWNHLGQWFDSVCQNQMDSSPEIEDHVRSLTASLASPSAKIAAIYYWLEDNFHFVSVDLGLSGYKPRLASETFRSRYGDAKDLSVLLAAMLRDAGVTARLAFLESGSARIISDRLPMARQLTHCIVIAEAGGKTYYLDSTAETAKYDVVLGRLCNTELLVLGKDDDKLELGPVYDGSKHGTQELAQLRLAADGSVTGQVKTEYLGESDAFLRAAIKYARPEQIRDLMEQEVQKNMPQGKLSDYEVGDVSARDRNFVTLYRFESPSWAEVKQGTIQFRPQLPQEIDISNEPFGKGERHFPILFYETAPSSVEMEVTIPDGYKVVSLPKDLEISNAFSYWKRTIRQDGNRIKISEVSHLKTVELPKESVTEIRNYFTEAAARKNELIVLKAP